MTRKKICMLGTSAVGKTSLVGRFVECVFSDRYRTTVGVHISRKPVTANGTDVLLMLWDLNGEDRFQRVSDRYLTGAAGYLLVVDGTRRTTLAPAQALHERAQHLLGPVPFAVALNKADLEADWELEPDDLMRFRDPAGSIHLTSAKTGGGVEDAFTALTERLLSGPQP